MLFKKSLSKSIKDSLDSFIKANYQPTIEAPMFGGTMGYTDAAPKASPPHAKAKKAAFDRKEKITPPVYEDAIRQPVASMPAASMRSLDQALGELDESFQEMLLRKIDESGMRDSACYKRAGVDRKLFSKIRSNPQYKPKKSTAIAFCIALELPYDEALEMLRKAGYALSRSSKFDVIVEYFIRNRRYDLNELNIALYEYDQPVI